MGDILPADLHAEVYDQWGNSGIEAAEYVYSPLAHVIQVLEDELDGLLFERDSNEELRSRVEEAVHILNSLTGS